MAAKNALTDFSDLVCRWCGNYVQLSFARYQEFIQAGTLPVCASCLRFRKRLGPLERFFKEQSHDHDN